MNDMLTLKAAAAEYRRLAGECDDLGAREIDLELAEVLEIVLRRLGSALDAE
ncbi:MAG: hypothetical protein JO255_12135 [Alphaproteobacteria bacterium]|nr:hypothetical protein [Alphaproteobacteria bacterium]